MQKVDINNLIDRNNCLNENIPSNLIITGEIYRLIIDNKYDQLDLSKIKCNVIKYYNQEENSIKNHKLPNSLQELICCDNNLVILPKLPNSLIELICDNNKLVSFPDLPNSLQKLICWNNKLVSLPDLPNSLIELHCGYNKIEILPDLPYSLKYLYCYFNKLTLLPNLPNLLEELFCNDNLLISIPKLPNSLKYLYCYNNQLISLPNLNRLKYIKVNNIVNYIDYKYNYIGKKIKFENYYIQDTEYDSYIEIKDYGKITSREEYIQYMEKIKLSKIKSARK